MRFTRGGVRDHIVSSKIDHGSPQWRWKATQQERSLKVSFREIFRVVRFSTFATLSANNGLAATKVERSDVDHLLNRCIHNLTVPDGGHRPLVNLQPKNVRPGVVSNCVEVDFAARDLVRVQLR